MLWNSWHTFIIVPLQVIFGYLSSVSVVDTVLHLPTDQQLICEQIPNVRLSGTITAALIKKQRDAGLVRSLLKWSVAAIERKMNWDNKALAVGPWQLLLPSLIWSIASFCVHQDRYSPQILIHSMAIRKSSKSRLRTPHCNLLSTKTLCNSK